MEWYLFFISIVYAKDQTMKNLHILALLSLVLLNLQILHAQKGWNKIKSGDNLVYSPTTLKTGKTFNYIFFKPVSLDGQQEKDWLLAKAKKEHSKLGKAQTPWKLKKETKGGWSVSNAYTNKRGEKMSAGYASKKLSNGKVYMLQMISSSDIGVLLKYGQQFKTVMLNAESIFKQDKGLASTSTSSKKSIPTSRAPKKKNTLDKKSKLTAKEKRRLTEKQIRTTPGKGAENSQIQVLWVNSGVDVLMGGIKVNTYLLLKDGTVYTDCEIPPNELLIKKSKELQPNKWTIWRKAGTSYQIKNKKKGTWKTLKGNRVITTQANEKLSKKYITTGGSQYRGSWENSITFKPNGRFEMSRFSMKDNASLGGGTTGPSVQTVSKSDKTGTRGTTVVSGSGVGGGATSQKNNGSANTGTYYLKGNTITLKHDNGYEHTELFFFDKKDKQSFIYKDDRYWIQKLKK